MCRQRCWTKGEGGGGSEITVADQWPRSLVSDVVAEALKERWRRRCIGDDYEGVLVMTVGGRVDHQCQVHGIWGDDSGGWRWLWCYIGGYGESELAVTLEVDQRCRPRFIASNDKGGPVVTVGGGRRWWRVGSAIMATEDWLLLRCWIGGDCGSESAMMAGPGMDRRRRELQR